MKTRKSLNPPPLILALIMLFSIFSFAFPSQARASDESLGTAATELENLIAEAEAWKAGNAEFQLQISQAGDGSDVNQAWPWITAGELEAYNAALESAYAASSAEEIEAAITLLTDAIAGIKSDGSDPYFRLDPGPGQLPVELTAPTNEWETRRPLDNRIPSDFAGGSVEMVDYPFADSEGKEQLLQINYVHNGKSSFGGISIESALDPAVEVPEGSTIEFDVYYPKSGQGKYMRWRIATVSTWNTTDSYMRDYDYTNLNPDWQGYYEGETWLKAHHSVVASTGMSSTFILELHGENSRPAETGTLLIGGIKISMPDPEGIPLPEVANTENQSEVAPLKSLYNEENGLFMVGAIGTGSVTGTRARHYEIFVDGNNLKAEPTHPRGPSWLKDTDGNPLNGAATEPGLGEYRFPTWAYEQIRDSGEEGEYKSHGHVLAWYNQAPSWMRQIIPEHLENGYSGGVEFYGLGNGVGNTVKVDKVSAKRIQFNHIMYVMRHFLTTDEKYGSSEERGLIPFHSWDVLNEEVHESRHSELIPENPDSWRDSLKHTNWLVAMSDDDISGDITDHYIYLLFKYAHIAAPNAQMAEAYKANYDSLPEYMKLDGHDRAGSIDDYVLENPPKLTYNDYGTATRSKARTIYNMVRELNTAWLSDPLYDGRPLIELIGFQGHDSVSPTLASDNQYAMAMYASLIDEGLLSGISFSEFDLKLLTNAPGGGATAPAALNVKQSDALGYQYALMYKLFTKFAPYIDHIISWGVSGSGWQGSYVLFDRRGNANAGYYGAMNPDRFILGHTYLDEYFSGEYEKMADDYVIDLGDLGLYMPGGMPAKTYAVQVLNGTGSGSYEEGDIVTIRASWNAGTFAGWYCSEPLTFVEGGKYSPVASFIMPAANVTVSAFYNAWTTPDPVPSPIPDPDPDPLPEPEPEPEPDIPWTNPFYDMSANDWFYKDVSYVVENGLMSGTTAVSFEPEAPITRAMLVAVLYRLEDSPRAGVPDFADVAPDMWYAPSIAWAAENNIVYGYDGNFRPDDVLTREQLAAILYRYAAYKGLNIDTRADLSVYTDAAAISDWALPAVRWANAEGLIVGVTDATFVPGGTASRAHTAAILTRFCQQLLRLAK